MKNIILVDTIHPVFSEMVQRTGFQVTDASGWSLQKIMKDLPDYNGICIRSRFGIDRAFLEQAKNLRFIARAGAGMENIDVAFATSLGIACLHAPEGNRDAVGEHVIGMLLSLFNHLNRADAEVRRGVWKREENRGEELKGKTVAVIGYGNMGSAFVNKLAGFEVDVLIYDKYKNVEKGAYFCAAGMEEIFERADVLSLHVPLNDETQYMINEEVLNKFKKNIVLINTSRGQHVNTEALVRALKNGKVKAAALDVLEYETSSFENLDPAFLPEPFRYLAGSDRVILTPHIAGWTVESNEKIARILAEKINSLYSLKT